MSKTLPEAFYRRDGDLFHATELTRGPWHKDFQHAGPPIALLARTLEAALPREPALQVARITVDILRPVPIAPLRPVAEVTAGRQSARATLRLDTADGVTVCRGTAEAIRTTTLTLPDAPAAAPAMASPDTLAPTAFPFFADAISYADAMELRFAAGGFGQGFADVWMRMRVPLVAGEAVSPLQRVMAAADSGNGVSFRLPIEDYVFTNPDLSVSLFRLPVDAWVGLRAATHTDAAGLGLADAQLVDTRGPIGRGVQTLLVAAR